ISEARLGVQPRVAGPRTVGRCDTRNRAGVRAMTGERLARLQELFEAALELPPFARADFVADVAHDDAALARQLDDLPSAHEATSRVDRLAESLARRTSRTPAPEDVTPTRIGPWSIVSLLGQGGMGTVYLAERADGAYERRVALKLMRRDMIAPDERRRFLDERQILARISHPCIATFIDGGVTDEGRPWYVMEYIDGRPITEWCDANRLDVAQRIALFTRVCDAVQHAHGALVVHRDIKPSHLLVSADGTPLLFAFGMARILDPLQSDDGAARTRTAVHRLAPEYASPEQRRCEPVMTASDVFQLGLLLFVLLTGRRASKEATTRASGIIGGSG